MDRNRRVWPRASRFQHKSHYILKLFYILKGNIAVVLECNPIIEVIKVQNNNSETFMLVEPLLLL